MTPAGVSNAQSVNTGGHGASTRVYTFARFVEYEHGLFHCLMALIVVVLCIVLTVLFRLENVSVVNLHLVGFTLQCAVPIAAVALYCHWAKYRRLRDGCWIVLWGCIFMNLLQLPQYAAARVPSPLRDAAFVKIDGFLGVDVGSIVSFVHRHPAFEALSERSYGLLPWIVFVAILVPALSGKLTRAKEYLLATILSALLAACALAVFPAVGPWAGYHFHSYWNQAWYVRELSALRSPGPFVANPDYTCGLITFPSFHVALAFLSVFVLWPFRWIRPFALLAAALIAIATVTTGWHYASDGIAGILTALIGVATARSVLRRLSAQQRELPASMLE
jgi:hypothetical protein